MASSSISSDSIGMPDLDFRLMPSVTVPGLLSNTGRSRPKGLSAPLTPAESEKIGKFTSRLNAGLAAQRQMMVAEAIEQTRQADLTMQQTLENDVRMLDQLNVQIDETNDRALALLGSLTGQDFGADPKPWQKWWTDQLGLVSDSSASDTKPTLTDTVAMPDTTLNLPSINVQIRAHHSCFAAGTLVQTIDGPRPIESIQLGDSVLSQDTATGALAMRPVVAVHVNKPQPTLRITIGGESIVATGIHRFWMAGKGWTMARDLKPGDRLRMVGGVVSIASINPDQTQPVFNLDVADSRDFFVGKAGLLVHDFTFVQPVLAPFDRLPEKMETASGGLTHAPSRAER